MKKITKILALMLVLVMGVCVFAGCGKGVDKKDPESVAKAFLDAILDFDYEKAAEYCGDGLKEQMEQTAEMVDMMDSEMLKEAKEEMKDADYKIVDVEEDGDEAVVTLELIEGDDSSEGALYLEKDGDEWVVVGMDE